MRWRRWLAVAGILGGAALLAFPLRGAVTQLIVIPLAYLLYALELLYLSLPQLAWWIAVVVLVLVVLGSSLLIETRLPRRLIEPKKTERGRVEHLASSMMKSQKGTYFKWLVANALGRLAYQILVLREHGKPRSVFAPLEADGWDPSPEVRDYLEKGLHGSFTELPSHSWISLPRRERTALDHDVAEVVGFLEASLNGENSPQRLRGPGSTTGPAQNPDSVG
jgi:membrane protein implicated in regulation of membrane protease activity